MDDLCTYRIQILGLATEQEINPRSPIQVKVEEASLARSLISVQTDQSGLMGLLRHLHGMGFVLLSVERQAVEVKEG